MMNFLSAPLSALSRPLARHSLAWLLLAVSALSTWAGGGPYNPSSDPDTSTNASSPGEEVTSLPMVDDVAGLTLVGTLRELRGLDMAIRGQGRVDVIRMGRRFIVTFVGDFRVELDRLALARSNVEVLFRGGVPFADGLARLQVGSSAPMLLDSERVPLPVVRLAGIPRALGDLVTLDVSSPTQHQAHLLASFARETVVIAQRLR